jgi:hypothetical protein
VADAPVGRSCVGSWAGACLGRGSPGEEVWATAVLHSLPHRKRRAQGSVENGVYAHRTLSNLDKGTGL